LRRALYLKTSLLETPSSTRLAQMVNIVPGD
jgi:hypothetical protein